MENLLDPAHLPFTHEGTIAKRKDAARMDMEVLWNSVTREMSDENDHDYQAITKMGMKGFKVRAFRPDDPLRLEAGGFRSFSFI